MTQRLTPMIHVPDIRAAVDWYLAIGFSLVSIGEDDGEAVWAELAFGEGRLMFNIGGQASSALRREVDLYLQAEGVDALYARLPPGVQVQEAPHDTFYGMREFIVRDLNGFWITFGDSKPAARQPCD